MEMTREFTDRETEGHAFEVRASSSRVLASRMFPLQAKVFVNLFVGMRSSALDLRVALHTGGNVRVTRTRPGAIQIPNEAGIARDEGMTEEIRDFLHRHSRNSSEGDRTLTTLGDRRFRSIIHVLDMLAFEVARKKFKELDEEGREQEQDDLRWKSADGVLAVKRDSHGRPSFHIHTEQLMDDGMVKDHVIELTDEDIRSLHEGIGWP